MLTFEEFEAQWHGAPLPDEPAPLPRHRGATAPLGARLLSRSALRGLPDPEPLIEGVLDKGSIALLYGRWGTGKSFLALDWACCVATGRAWQGRRTERERVLYVAAEGAYGLKGRLDAWETGWRTTVPGVGSLDVLPAPVNLTRGVEVAELAALVEVNRYGLVVVDTLARCMVGADENSAKDCGEVVDALHRIREASGRGVVLAVHHAGKDGRTFRGSSAFEAGADTVYAVHRDGAVIVLEREKRKDGPVADTHRLRLVPIEGTPSAVVKASHLGETHLDRAAVLLSHFQSHFATTGAHASELREVSELPKATFYRALNDLVKRGELVNVGTDKRPFYRLAKP